MKKEEKVTIDNYFAYFADYRREFNNMNLNNEEKISVWQALYKNVIQDRLTTSQFNEFYAGSWVSPNGIIHEKKPANYSEELKPEKMIDDFLKRGVAIWVTKEKEEINVCDMDDNHIINTYKFLLKKNSDDEIIKTWIKIFELELEERNLSVDIADVEKKSVSVGLDARPWSSNYNVSDFW